MTTPDPRDLTLPGRLWRLAAQHPDRVALREKGHGVWRELTWATYRDMVHATARQLDVLGVGLGDHVAILSDNRTEWLFADLGAQLLGARSVGVYQTNPPEDVAYILDHSQSEVLFCEDQEQVDKAIAVADQTPTLAHIIVFDPRGTQDYDDPRLLSWEAFIKAGQALAADDATWLAERLDALDPDAPAMVVYTSGTTGPPKGAMLSSRNALESAQVMVPLLGLGDDDQLLSYLPLCHVAEKIFSIFLPLAAGSVVHFGESIGTIQTDLQEVAPSVFLGVPRIWEKMHASVTLKMKDSSWLKRTLFDTFTTKGRAIADKRLAGTLSLYDRLVWLVGAVLVFWPLQERLGLARCRLPVTGAAPISPDLLRWFWGIGVPILEGYGQTECAGVSHLNPPEKPKLGSVGKALPLVECRLAEDGEILVRGPMVFAGYLHQTEATRDTVDDEGWLHTGDIGKLDAEGYLSITGRKKEIIITAGGKNLSPEKIENALKMSPYIKEVVAIGDARKYVAALVQADSDAVGDWAIRRRLAFTSYEDLVSRQEVLDLIAAEVEAANERLARVEQVRRFALFPSELHQDEGELTATQKVRRRAIVESYSALIETLY